MLKYHVAVKLGVGVDCWEHLWVATVTQNVVEVGKLLEDLRKVPVEICV